MTLRKKINERLDKLEQLMNTNSHLTDPESVLLLTESITKFWSVLSEEDQDYIHGVRYAVEEGIEWKK